MYEKRDPFVQTVHSILLIVSWIKTHNSQSKESRIQNPTYVIYMLTTWATSYKPMVWKHTSRKEQSNYSGCMKLPVYLLGPATLQITEAQTLLSKNVPEKLVLEVTGHRSLECLRQHEKAAEQNLRTVSKSMTFGSQFKVLTESQPNLKCSSSSTKLQPTIYHLVNSLTAQPVHSGTPTAIPNYSRHQHVQLPW